MRKTILIIVAIVVIAVAGFFIWISMPPAPTTAVLYVESGVVEVDLGKGWQSAVDEMELDENSKVRTMDGEASVVLLAGEVVHLEPNTEISLDEVSDDKISIKQLAGETWNKVSGISGVAVYEVGTPTTVATVRGTEFFVKIGELDEVGVLEGVVDLAPLTDRTKIHKIKAMRKAFMDKLGEVREEELGPEDIERAKRFKEKYIANLKATRLHEILKHKTLLKMAKTRYGVDEAKIKQFLEDVDAGKENEDELYEQIPGFLKKRAELPYKITKFIKKAQAQS